ncbi:MAG: TonB-dependent receptor [Acidobacteriota bacterium]
MKLGVLFAIALIALLFLAVDSAVSQESRGSITGRVVDPQGAVIPGAAVVVTNVQTNVVNRTATNVTGYFEVNLLNPGRYSVTVEAAGFRTSVRSGLELNVAGRVEIEVAMQVGQVAETIEVTAEAPLLDTTTASAGRVLDNRQIMQLPFNDLNPFALATLAPGMHWTGQPAYRRPFDNAGTSSFNTMGGVGQNEYTIDNAPVTGTGRRVGFTPPADAVEEFKLETASFDAAYGHTSGATVNVMTKAGTNTFHGSLYDQHWQQRWNATRHFTRLAWEDQVRQGKLRSDSQKQAPGRSNNFGGTLGGPIAKDKLFFFFSYNGIYQKKAEDTSSINRTVPKVSWRQGDFSDLLGIDAVKYTVYDPRSSREVGGRVVRTPFPGNKGIPVLNPLYKFYEPLYPKPNDVPSLVSPEGFNNWYAVAMPKDERFNSLVNRVDYSLSERHKIFGRWYWNHRLADEYDWTYPTKRGLHANGLVRINKGGGGNYIWTLSNTSILDLGLAWNRFSEGSERPVQTKYKPSEVGLPSYLDAKAGDLHLLPRLEFNNLEDFGAGYPVIGIRGATGTLRAQMTTVIGDHSFKYGWEERRYWTTTGGPGYTSGQFSFNNSYMRQADNTNTASNHGLEWAAFMMGVPSGVNIDSNDSAYWSTRYRALFFHDDWRLTSKLRLNLGLRYEREGGITERFNRAIAGGFLFDYKPVFADLVQAAYAKSPLPELPAAQFRLMGGTEYLGGRHKTFTDGTHHLLPRLGLVYQLSPRTVLRAGYGWWYDTYNTNNDRPNQDGFSKATSTILTTDRGLSWCCGVGSIGNLAAGRNPMVDPFPVRADGTRFDTPYGNSLGSMMRQGRGWSFVPRNFSASWQQRWRFGIQRELTNNMVIEVAYSGAYARIPVTQSISFLPRQYWATGNVRNQAVDDRMNTNVPNPFNIANLASLQTSDPKMYNYLSTVGFFTGKTIRKHQLLRAFPNMNGLSGLRPGVEFSDARGGNRYHDLQLQLNRRFSRGFQTAVMYTYARAEESDYYHNDFDDRPSWRPQDAIRPHRFVWSAVWELPFGRNRTWTTEGPLQHVIGGWQLSWVYQYQTGGIPGWGNRFFYGDVSKIGDLFNHEQVHARDIHVWFDPATTYRGTAAVPSGFQGFEGRSALQPGSYHVRVFPTRLSELRADGIRNWDIKVKRVFRITERLRTSFDVDLLNATNHTNFSGPNTDPTNRDFGRVTSQNGLSRLIQFNLRVDF